MPETTAVKNMTRVAVNMAQEKVAAGDYPEATRILTGFIEGIESNSDDVHAAFGRGLVAMYCLRAKCQLEAGSQSDEPARLDMARADVSKAEEALDRYCDQIKPEQKESIKASIRNVTSADATLRAEGMAAATQLATVATVDTRPATPVGLATRAHAMLFLVGLALWAVLAAVAWMASRATQVFPSGGASIVLGLVGVVLLFILLDWSYKGWDWLSGYSERSYGGHLKSFLQIFLLVTGVGAIPVAYWTGKGAMRWYYKRYR